MIEKLIRRLIPQSIGLLLIVFGWYMSIINVGLDKIGPTAIISKWTLIGLSLILTGAYLPQIWIFFLNKFQK